MGIDGGTDGITEEDDHHLSREEWDAALPKVRRAGATWAASLALRDASKGDFDVMDQNRGGYINLQEFCNWLEAAEKRAGASRTKKLAAKKSVAYAPHGRDDHYEYEYGSSAGSATPDDELDDTYADEHDADEDVDKRKGSSHKRSAPEKT